MTSILDDPTYKKYVADQLRLEHPELKDASDDEVISVVKKVEVPDATPDEWSTILTKLHPAPEKPKKESNIPGLVAAGAVGLGVGALGAAFHMRSKVEDFGKMGEISTTPPIEPSPSFPETPKQTTIPQAEPLSSELPINPPTQPTEPQPFKPTSRALHQFEETNVHAMKKLESDPVYLEKLKEMGGGKQITHNETLSKAFSSPPMTVEELSNWKAGTPTSELDVARANILRVYWWDKYLEALKNDDAPSVKEITNILTKIEPGYNNLSATPGRALEFQKVFQFSKKIQDKVSELKAINAPYEQVKTEINKLIEQEKKDANPGLWSRFGHIIERIQDYSTAAKLTSPVTHMVNTVSNSLVFAQRSLEKLHTSAGLALTGDSGTAKANLKYAWGTGSGWIDASRKFLHELTTAEPIDYGKSERKIPKGKPLPLPLRVMSPFRWLVAADNFWKTIIVDSELHTKAYTQAASEGRTGSELSKRVIELIENPPQIWTEEAKSVAKEYTFQEDPDKLLRAIQSIQNVPGVRLIVPFVQTPYNIIRFYNRRSLFGITAGSFWRDLNAGGIRRVEALSRLNVGLGITGATLAMINLGQITGAYPASEKERSTWIAEGKRPWSIKVGDHWLTYSRIQPIGLYLMTVAAINQAYKDNNFEKAENKLGKVLTQLIKGPLDLPFLQGMSAAMDAIQDPQHYSKNLLQLTATGFIPNILRDVRSQVDPTERKPETVLQAIKTMIPGLSTDVPPRVTVLGEERKATESRVLRATKMVSDVTETDKTRLMNEIGWAPPVPNTKLNFKGKSVDLQGDLKQKFLVEMGKAASEAMDRVMNMPKFIPLTKEQKIKVLQKVTERYQTPVLKKYKALSGLYGQNWQDKMNDKVNSEEELGGTDNE